MVAWRLDHLVTGNSRKIVCDLVQYLVDTSLRILSQHTFPSHKLLLFSLSYTAALTIIVGLRPASRSYVLMSLIPNHLLSKDHTVSDTAG